MTDKHTTDRRQTHDRQTADTRQTAKFILQFLSPRGPRPAEKKFQLNQKKKNFRDFSNLSPSELRTYN